MRAARIHTRTNCPCNHAMFETEMLVMLLNPDFGWDARLVNWFRQCVLLSAARVIMSPRP